MFSKGNWSIFCLDTANTSNPPFSSDGLLLHSQAIAALKCWKLKSSTYGINPYGSPRLDDCDGKSVLDIKDSLAQRVNLDIGLSADEKRSIDGRYSGDISAYTLVNKVFGFWFVENTWDDTLDATSSREHSAYNEYSAPFPYLTKIEKESIVSKEAQNSITRKQFPVILDLASGLLFAESTNAEQLEELSLKLEAMGCPIRPSAWVFQEGWVERFLSYIDAESRYKQEFFSRAQEVSKRGKEGITTSEDKMVEKILSSCFRFADVDSGESVGLSSVAQIKVEEASDPISVSSNTNAVLLLQSFADSRVTSANVTFYEVGTKIKKGEDTQYCKPLFSMQVGPTINDTKFGFATMRGLNMVQVKKDMTRARKMAKKQSTSVSIAEFWMAWRESLIGSISAFKQAVASVVLNSDNSEPYGILPID